MSAIMAAGLAALTAFAGVPGVAGDVGAGAAADAGAGAGAGHEVIAMQSSGFDAQVAEANGFEIVTDAEGRIQSVPVTAEAKALIEQAESDGAAGGAADAGTADASFCGGGWLELELNESGDKVQIRTGYDTVLPVTSRHWRVQGIGGFKWFESSFHGQASGETAWQGLAAQPVSGGGVGTVSIDSHVVLSNGELCYLGGHPTKF